MLTAWAAAVLVVGGPDWLSGGFATYDNKRLLLLAVLAGGGLLLALHPGLRRGAASAWGALPFPARGLVTAFGALGLASALAAPRPGPALAEWGLVLALGLFAVGTAVSLGRLGRTGDGVLLAALGLGTVLYMGDFYAAYMWATWGRDVPISWGSPFHDFVNVRFFNQVQTWTLPLLTVLAVWAYRLHRGLGALFGLAAIAWWALLFATGGRGALVAQVLGAALAALFLGRSARPWLAAHSGLAVGGALLYAPLFHHAAPGVARAAEKAAHADSARLALWADALDLTATHPWLGVGPMHFASGESQSTLGHPHNAALQIAAEWGLPAALFLAAALIWGLWAWLRARRSAGTYAGSRHAFLVAGVACAILAGLGHAMVSGIAVMPASQFLGAAIVGWAWGLHLREQPPARVRRGWWLPATSATVLVPLLVPASQQIPVLETARSQYSREVGKFHPRFWVQGDLEHPPWTHPSADLAEGPRQGP
ncbi:MAG: O-antigen ligase family protein [Thiohalorhabdus sp.]|uniref:O-antigen ligase family protein n=1 Tax=Thiohalorhabdus sp. TaxID=3094134 RepID=UPI00397EDD37